MTRFRSILVLAEVWIAFVMLACGPVRANATSKPWMLPKERLEEVRRELREHEERIRRLPPTERKFYSAPYVCDKSKPLQSLISGIRRVAIEKGSLESKDETGIYVKGLGKTYFISWQTEQHYIRRLSEWNEGTPTAEVIVFENWAIKKACVVWLFPDKIGSVAEFDLSADLPKHIRSALGVVAGARGKLAKATTEVGPTAHELIETLSTHIFPADLDLSGIKRILIRPGGVTSQIPFLTLYYRGDRVGGRFALVVLESIKPKYPSHNIPSDFSRPMHSSEFGSDDNILIVGNPTFTWDKTIVWQPIANTEIEAKTVAGFFGSEPLLGERATKAAVLARLANAGYIHLATHAVTDETNPMDASLVVLSDGYLTARDISRKVFYFHSGPLVVLSACQTALGKPFEGGTYGLARTFLVLGAEQVLANLWNVDDIRSGAIATSVAQKVAKGVGMEFALREVISAQIAEEPETPGYWGSFLLYGTPTGYGMIDEDDPANDEVSEDVAMH